MPNRPNSRPFVPIGTALSSKRAAQTRARSMNRMHPTHVYTVTPKTDKGYYVQRAA